MKTFLAPLAAVLLCLGFARGVAAQNVPVLPAGTAAVDPKADCCGAISPEGARLAAFIDKLDVEHFWLSKAHVDWKTGKPDHPGEVTNSTHCSAFAAAAGYYLNVYMLRPPEHPTLYLATAQVLWFGTDAGRKAGWRAVTSQQEAQRLANNGSLVVIGFASPDEEVHGHIVVVRPAVKTNAELAVQGPQVAQAATHNRNTDWASRSFIAHPGAWPNKVTYFAHDVDWAAIKQ